MYVMALIAFFHELFLSLNVKELVSFYMALLFILLMYWVSSWNVFLFSKTFTEDIIKFVDLSVWKVRILQKVKFKVRYTPQVYFNVAGFALPTSLAICLAYIALWEGLITPTLFILSLTFLTLTYNRFSKIVKGNGVLIPIASSIAVTTALMIMLTTYLSLSVSKAFITTYSLSCLASVLGIDFLNLKSIAVYKSRYVVIGGYSLKDALVVIPALSSLTVKALLNVMIAYGI